eukprot:TRINITY_DN12196_c0_g1_i1.p1 TRINITY_DN12196_c0_g1~~TRINITY_DN12196_c0_g1_i1.p1  ORF type:complete len:111 (+),score=14.52 TRINITY_DN12196_c0_g1_i1:48-335(+)
MSVRTLRPGFFAFADSLFQTKWAWTRYMLGAGVGIFGLGILLGVPKKKISLSRSRQRRNVPAKQRHNLSNIESCYGCGQPKLRQHACLKCAGWRI